MKVELDELFNDGNTCGVSHVSHVKMPSISINNRLTLFRIQKLSTVTAIDRNKRNIT